MLKWEKLDTGVYTSECRAFHVEALKQILAAQTLSGICVASKRTRPLKNTQPSAVFLGHSTHSKKQRLLLN